MLICPEASSAQNSMAAVSADGSTVCVLILRLNPHVVLQLGHVFSDVASSENGSMNPTRGAAHTVGQKQRHASR
jgi:hypothetical protein